MKTIFGFLVFIFIGNPVFAGEAIIIGEKFVLQSEILGEERPYFVNLPESYNDSKYQPKQYPVLYILDGSVHFHSASGVINHMSAGKNGNTQIPELIVVAIPNTSDRTRDLTPSNAKTDHHDEPTDRFKTSGGGDKFLAFIEKELIPEIENRYRTRPHRTFVGHSFGGLTMLHSFLSQPGLFNNYIAIDSSFWWDKKVMVKRVQDFVAQDANRKARLYFSVAEHDSTGRFSGLEGMTVTNIRVAEWLEKAKSPDLHVKIQHYAGEDHGSVPLPSLYYGLLHVFDGYKASLTTYIDGAESVAAHFEAFSEKAGADFLPPENAVDMAAEFLTDYMTPEVQLELLQLNTRNYPESAHAKKRLEDALNIK